ncbi:uncharacterized protein SAPINGB_P005309 [Magnusiomyces paraingens]|uniref:Pre-rRNA-processing protein ESF2 n=1 Tax=Magnusiomyces paraingens TaxID=2606893 RepID=A0A5E8C0C3_9ASCO|nr:uncharacterized protein SAPINGB_P005309 [Saprochaete ingens]VVT56822.1 unnamed protein product [Saprochaete ingens]
MVAAAITAKNPRKKAVDFFSSSKSKTSVEQKKKKGNTSSVKKSAASAAIAAKFDPLARVKHSDDEDDDEDEDEDQDEDEEEEESKSNSLSFSKFESDEEDDQDEDEEEEEDNQDDDNDNDDDEEEEEISKGSEKPSKLKRDVFADDDEEEDEEEEEEEEKTLLPNDEENQEEESKKASIESKLKARKKSAEAAAKRSKKSGLVYISRVPEFLTPGGMRHILTKYGPVDRIYLVPEPASVREQRMAHGGSKQRMYIEGWAEFERKKDAKLCASVLNGRGSTIGGKNRRGRFYDTVMAVRYLHKFKWNDLAEQMVVEKEARVEKLRKEIGMANEENRLFAHGVAMAKAMKKREANSGSGGVKEGKEEMLRTFDQRETRTKRAEVEGDAVGGSAKRRKTVGGNMSQEILAQIM